MAVLHIACCEHLEITSVFAAYATSSEYESVKGAIPFNNNAQFHNAIGIAFNLFVSRHLAAACGQCIINNAVDIGRWSV